jgi:peptidoglycan/LPS O-acetylase OafA/YrhL
VRVLAGVVVAVLALSVAAMIVGLVSVEQTCKATSEDDAAFVTGLVCFGLAVGTGVIAIVQALRRRRARPHFWWYLGSAAAAVASVFASTIAVSSSFAFCPV